MNKVLNSIEEQDIRRISSDYTHPFLRDRYFICLSEEGDKATGMLAFFGNYHYLSLPKDVLIKPVSDEREMILALINRKMDESIYEVYEFSGLATKHELLRIQKIVNKYQSNLSVWEMKQDELLQELENEMARQGIPLPEIKTTLDEIISSYLIAYKRHEEEINYLRVFHKN